MNIYDLGKMAALKDLALDAWEKVLPTKTPELATGFGSLVGGAIGTGIGTAKSLHKPVLRQFAPDMRKAVRPFLQEWGGGIGGLVGGVAGGSAVDAIHQKIVRNQRSAAITKHGPKVALGAGAALLTAGLLRHAFSRNDE